MRYTNGGYVFDPDEVAVKTGPITGGVTLKDGTAYDVSPEFIGVPVDHHEEVGHLIGLRYEAEGHPHHDERTPFVYEAPDRFADYEPHPDNDTLQER
jgi:hypothetical protein